MAKFNIDTIDRLETYLEDAPSARGVFDLPEFMREELLAALDYARDALAENRVISGQVEDAESEAERAWGAVESTETEIANLRAANVTYASANAALQGRAMAAEAKLDALMLEYRPEEMTNEQRERWAKSQRASSDSFAINEAFAEIRLHRKGQSND